MLASSIGSSVLAVDMTLLPGYFMFSVSTMRTLQGPVSTNTASQAFDLMRPPRQALRRQASRGSAAATSADTLSDTR